MKRLTVTSIFLLILTLLGQSVYAEGIPNLINYQGQLTDESGNMLDTTVSILFTVCDSVGVVKWSETHSSVTTTDGLFCVLLGSINPIPDSAFDHPARYLGITVGSDPELIPRSRLVSAPYSYRALHADTASYSRLPDGHSLDAVDGSQTNVVFVDAEGDVAVGGISNPKSQLHVYRDGYSGDASVTLQIYEEDEELYWHLGMDRSDSHSFKIGTGWQVGGGYNYMTMSQGNTGFGTTQPYGLVDIHSGDFADRCLYVRASPSVANQGGVIHHQSGTYAWQEIGQNLSSTTSGYLKFHLVERALPQNKHASDVLVLRGNGSVGVNVEPSYTFDVAGPAHASSFPTSSDARFKKNVRQLKNVLNKLTQVRGVSFEWNEKYDSLGRSTGHNEIGVIAQELEEVFPELVTTWGDGDYRAVDYGRLTAVLTEAIKELSARNESLRSRLEKIELKLAFLTNSDSD